MKKPRSRKIKTTDSPITVDIYTDGACSGNPGPGGWGAILRYHDFEREMNGGERYTTNNRMEMTAVIEALRTLLQPCTVNLHTDSQYVINGMTEWLVGWKRNGWRTHQRKPVNNIDLWKNLDQLCVKHKVNWFWVKGHNGHPENERADLLARNGIPTR